MHRPVLNYTLKCDHCGRESIFEADSVSRPWHCDFCGETELRVWDFSLYGSGYSLTARAVEEYLENWSQGDGIEYLLFMDQAGRSIREARDSLLDVVSLDEYDDYVIEQFINGRQLDDDVIYYLDASEIISDFEAEHIVIDLWNHSYIFL